MIKQAVSTTVTSGATAAIGWTFYRPPIPSAIFMGASLVAKHHFLQMFDASKYNHKSIETVFDLALLSGYFQSSKYFIDTQLKPLDFCWGGSVMAYFIGQNVYKMCNRILCVKKSDSEKASPSFWNDLGYVATAATAGLFVTSVMTSLKKRRRTMYIMEAVAAVALIEKVSARVLSHYSFGDKIGLSHDTLHLGVSIFLYVAKLKVFGSNYFAGHALTTLFWNACLYQTRLK
jgi:hypothetical protein